MKLDSFTVVDVETPNADPHSVCQIALIEVKEGRIVWEYETLINPEEPFDEVCINVHGILPGDVKNAPTLKEVWPEIAPHYVGRIIAAHSAAFDTSVIAKSLQHYGIYLPKTRYVCTFRMALDLYGDSKKRAARINDGIAMPDGLSLDKLCEFFNIELLNHHNAKADTEACYRLLCRLLQIRDLTPQDFYCYVLPYPDVPVEKRTYLPLGGAGTSYCLTGNFCYGFKGQVKELIESSGGICYDSLRRNTDYLVIGGKNLRSSKKKAFAEKLIREGYPLQIIDEAALLEALKPKRGFEQRQLF